MFIVPIIIEVGTNTSHHFLIEKTYCGQYPPFRGLNGGYRGLMGIYVFHIFPVKAVLKGHHEPLETINNAKKH